MGKSDLFAQCALSAKEAGDKAGLLQKAHEQQYHALRLYADQPTATNLSLLNRAKNLVEIAEKEAATASQIASNAAWMALNL